MRKAINRRRFLGAAVAPAVFQVVPRHVLGQGYVAPNDKITLAYIGLGTQGLRELGGLLNAPEVQIGSVCDPNTDSTDYVDWSRDGLRSEIGRLLGRPDWRAGSGGIPGGREVGREVIQAYYAAQRGDGSFKGVSSYADFRELLAKEPDVDAVKIMTPDHLHATIAIAAMNRGKHVMMHKPLANRLRESRLVLETARRTGVATYLLAWSGNGSMDTIMAWIRDGAIGTLREVHNWSNRPVWPQYATLPQETPPVPEGFDWDLWLGPALERPYHPHYTHAVFRGWYDFGGGAIADMGHYSLWAVFKALELDAPVRIEATPSHVAAIDGQVSRVIRNDWSFPVACSIRFQFAAKGDRPALDLFWYDGGMRPLTPDELEEDAEPMPAEGMMFVGDTGKILSGFSLQEPRIIPKRRMRDYAESKPGDAGQRDRRALAPGVVQWLAACKGGAAGPGSFLEAEALSETINLGAVALRVGRKVTYDAAAMQITNMPEANSCLTREYRPGWEL
ncbi:MAG TPA: Gfo/Idh/MocA family oxidoreductase [Candidatus Hydrogenedentes bacterium]|nr:Gfo/Idh/MocA family oxidoreductase [Candidatus Hydrogenedentota bacterium]